VVDDAFDERCSRGRRSRVGRGAAARHVQAWPIPAERPHAAG